MQTIKSFGIVGSGEFGHVVARHLAPLDAEVLMFDADSSSELPPRTTRASLAEVSESDAVVLAVPFDSYEDVVPRVTELSSEDSLVIDVCSVKVKPTRSFQDNGLLERPNVLMTHPLFGPQSTQAGVEGKSMVVTDADGPKAKELVEAWGTKGIKFVDMTADEHDKEMAKVHVLPFIIGRSLLKMGITDSALATNYFGKLTALVEVERHHSPELFNTIQQHNPYAANMRSEFIATICSLHAGVVVDGHHLSTDHLEALESHRAALDVIDHYRMVLLGLRFAITEQIGELKARADLPAVDPALEKTQQEVIANDAERFGVPPELAVSIQELIRRAVVKRHEAIKTVRN